MLINSSSMMRYRVSKWVAESCTYLLVLPLPKSVPERVIQEIRAVQRSIATLDIMCTEILTYRIS